MMQVPATKHVRIVDHPPILQVARRSALFALPFVLVCIAAGFALDATGLAETVTGAPTKPWLGALISLSLFAPALVELILRTPLPRPLQLHYIIFIIAGPFAGSGLGLYNLITEWDTVVHFDSGVMLAWLGMLAVRRAEERIGVALPVWFALVVAQTVSMAFAAAWEISEYLSDVLIGTTAQKGNLDTMSDIVAGTLGALLAIVLLVIFRRPRTLAPYALLRD